MTTPPMPPPDPAALATAPRSADALARIDALVVRRGSPPRTVLAIEHLRLAPGERVFLHGPSGSGKSTLLAVLAGLLPADAGSVELLGQRLERLPPAARDALRAERLGVIFQLFNLVPYLSVLDNVLLPCRFSAARRARAAGQGAAESEARRLLAHLGLADPALLARPAGELSVGQQQRVAAARALIGRPALVLADEPTSALDAAARAAFLDLLFAECAAGGCALLFASHDRALEPRFDRVLDLAALDGATEPAR